MVSTIISLLFIVQLLTTNGYEILNLSQRPWYLQNPDLNISLSTKVPGSVHTTLLAHNLIKDPYVGFRDVQYAWIADQDWVFKTTFQISDEEFDHPYVRLKFLGLDTIASIYFNNILIGKSTNMFTSVTFQVHAIGKTNSIDINFHSPTQYAKNQSTFYQGKYGYDVPPLTAPPAQHGRDCPNFIRKEQCSFSWDWGPSFPTVGIWKPAILEFSSTVFLDELKVTPNLMNGEWHLVLEVTVESFIKQDVDFVYGFDNVSRKDSHLITEGVQNVRLAVIIVEDSSVIRWWPVGYGNAYLYTGSVMVMDGEESFVEKRVNFGFRTVELIEEPINGSDGLSFYFKINSQPIFLKGANWIPADSFQERVTESVLMSLLWSARDANINALRVWGGGVYEQDRFYELADEMGILIWQDLMFAVALYPVNDEFLENVANEIKHQVRRLHSHPSIIAWSGNNENEAAIAQTWWDEVKTNKERLVSDYGKLYNETIKPIITTEDTTRPFVMSSPSNGNENEAEHYIAKNPQDPLYGDVHFYDYSNDCWNPETFPNPRFASEYGYQSYPSFQAISDVVTSDVQLAWNSSLLYHRQHHANGNSEIERFIGQHFELPRHDKPAKEYLASMLYLSQIVQGLCVKYESEHYRRLQDNLINGKGHTMGALYWQLNDIWQGPSWSSIEYGGRWKLLHFYVTKFFAPTAVSAYVSNGSVVVYLVQDHLKESHDGRMLSLNVSVHSWKSFNLQWNETKVVNPSKQKHSIEIYRKRLQDLPLMTSSFMKIQLVHPNFGDVVSDTEVFFSNFSSEILSNPNLRVQVLKTSATALSLQINSDTPAAFVWLESPVVGRFSDNGFLMNKPYKVITFYDYGDIHLKASDFEKTIKITSLHDAYSQT